MTKYLRVSDKDTSVKSLGVLKEPTATETGTFDFIYRNRYSVFDWGEMPMPAGHEMDNRPVALTAAFNYEMVQDLGFPVAYMGTVDKNGFPHPVHWFRQNKEVPNALRLKMVNIFKPTHAEGKWNYDAFKDPKANNYVHPVEFIWRAQAGPDSSFWKNIARGNYKLEDFGLPKDLKPGDKFPAPVLDHSSKYETHDRYFSPAVAQELAAISPARWMRLNHMRDITNWRLSYHARQLGFDRPDGKQEYAVMNVNGEPVDLLVDVAGTWHEDRFTYTTKDRTKVKVSKQTPRDLHKLLDSEWAKQCDEGKKRAETEGHPNWKDFVTARPRALEPAFFGQYNNLMRAATSAWVGWNAFPESSGLEEACVEFDKYLSNYKTRLKRTG